MENKASFFARLQPIHSTKDLLDIELAYTLAKFGHRYQSRKEKDENNEPIRYFEHVRRVAIILMDELKVYDKDMIIAALCHDILEDCQNISSDLLGHCFGSQVVQYIKFLSKTPKEGYFERLKSAPIEVLILKACDRLDNLRSLMVPGTSTEFHKKQIKETKEIYFPLFDKMIASNREDVELRNIRDEIRRLVKRYTVMIEMKDFAQ